MSEIPTFRLFGEGDSAIERSIQPELVLRDWSALNPVEKQIIAQELVNNRWLEYSSRETLATIEYLNRHYLAICPGKLLHKASGFDRGPAARQDFINILLRETMTRL